MEGSLSMHGFYVLYYVHAMVTCFNRYLIPSKSFAPIPFVLSV
jgi:hypothetical protein